MRLDFFHSGYFSMVSVHPLLSIRTTLALLLLIVAVLLAAGCAQPAGDGNTVGMSTINAAALITATPSGTQTLIQCGSPKNPTPGILINPIGNHFIGENIRLNGTTNLEAGQGIRISVYASTCDCAPIGQNDKNGKDPLVFEQDTTVTAGVCGENIWSVSVNTSKLKADEYIVTAGAVNQNVTGTSLFSIVETPLPTVYGDNLQQNSTTNPVNP
jgi:hypothetical protein